MQIKRFTVRMDSPAFLGDAEQNGFWRAPPFKAQLRQWWRVAWSARHGFPTDIARMREEEGHLFGNAWLKDDFCKSRVRLRLTWWVQGTLSKTAWKPLPKVSSSDGKQQVAADAYLGYGPIDKGALKRNAALQVGESAQLALAWPEDEPGATLLEQVLWLMDRFGTVGGRSRNGWGSYALEPLEGTPAPTGQLPLRDWRQCLDRDWPHAIGEDEHGPLIWATAPKKDWREVMRTLAELKIGFRTQFRVSGTGQGPQERHWLAYPVTKHSVGEWERQKARLPNQLRFKLRRLADGHVRGEIFHLPHLPPPAFGPNHAVIESVWKRVHGFLDGKGLRHIKE